MTRYKIGACLGVALALALPAFLIAAPASNPPDRKPDGDSQKSDGGKFEPFKSESVTSTGTVTIGGQAIAYQAVAGTLIVHPKDWDDVPRDPKADRPNQGPGEEGGEGKNPTAEASMFYVAYFKNGARRERPVTFLYNGGPGSSTVWLHMGAFGPRRVVTADDTHTPAAPYSAGQQCLEPARCVSDLVFIDAPGTGFSRIAGKDKEKAFYGVDQDAHAFAQFISQFLSKYGRWNSPKYLFGESYGTPRSAVLVNQHLETERSIDFNGVILLSQILNFDLSPDRPEGNPGIDLPYRDRVLPTYAATAWYHHKLAGRAEGPRVAAGGSRAFRDGRLCAGAGGGVRPEPRRYAGDRARSCTSTPACRSQYILKANLRIDGGEFGKNLQETPTSPPAASIRGSPARHRSAEQARGIRSAIRGAELGLCLGVQRVCAQGASLRRGQDLQAQHIGVQELELRAPAAGSDQRFGSSRQGSNVMPDLANAMKYNPNLKVMLNAGYFDLATPFYEGSTRCSTCRFRESLQAQYRVQLLRLRPHGLRQ